jgi:hypothetical protein
MASRTEITRTLDTELQLLTADVADLDYVYESWDETPMHDRLAFESEWRSSMARLDTLIARDRAGELSKYQSACLDALLALLRQHVDVIKRLGLALPTHISR